MLILIRSLMALICIVYLMLVPYMTNFIRWGSISLLFFVLWGIGWTLHDKYKHGR